MKLSITPKEIQILKKKGINITEFQEVRRHWSNQLKEIKTNLKKNGQ